MNPSTDLTIVSSCAGGYGKYLDEWAASIGALTVKPAAVCLFTHGSVDDRIAGEKAMALLAGIPARHEHCTTRLDFGTARNRAVEMSATEWVQHLDCDDTAMPHMLEDVALLADTADVVALGYERSGNLHEGPSNRRRLYSNTTGLQALDAAAPCSGVSPFRRSFWERSPYRTDMRGAWDTALWIGFARQGARFRATTRPCFWYRQHADSIFNKRRTTLDWTHQLTTTQLRHLRADYRGTAVIVPRDREPDEDRRAAWRYVRSHYGRVHPDWPIVEGFSRADAWCKGEAIADALTRTNAALLVIADADCVVSPMALERSVHAVEYEGAPWAIPHGMVYRLNADSTAQLLDGGSLTAWTPGLDRPAYQGFAGGGIFVVSRVAYEATGGIPRAFRGWGGEDEAFARMLDCLIGPHVRGDAPLTHLWHAPQTTKPPMTPQSASTKPWLLGNRQPAHQIQVAATKGPDELWKVLQKLITLEPKPKRIKTPEEIAERRRAQSFLGRRGR